jgi:glycosyltransferase involved in cell wall biosynthesis
LNTDLFQPLEQDFCRQTLSLPLDRQIILFGAMYGGEDPRKGYDLLRAALEQLAQSMNRQNVLCVIFGQIEPATPQHHPFPVRWMGPLYDDATLALLYNSADVMVVPSRQENLPQTATEAQACGCPVVAFDCTGLKDAVVHQETGFLAKAFDTTEMAEGIKWVLADPVRRQKLGRAARERALRLWSADRVVPRYLSVCRSAIEQAVK